MLIINNNLATEMQLEKLELHFAISLVWLLHFSHAYIHNLMETH